MIGRRVSRHLLDARDQLFRPALPNHRLDRKINHRVGLVRRYSKKALLVAPERLAAALPRITLTESSTDPSSQTISSMFGQACSRALWMEAPI